MNYIPLSQAGDEYLKSLRIFEHIKHKYIQLDFSRAKSCDLEVIFIATDELELKKIENNDLDTAIIKALHEAWLEICGGKIHELDGTRKRYPLLEDHCARLINPEHEKGFLIRSLMTGSKTKPGNLIS